MDQQPKGVARRCVGWKSLLSALLSAALLLPVPAFAFNWASNSNWTASGTPVNVTNTLGTGFGAVAGEPDWLFIQPTSHHDQHANLDHTDARFLSRRRQPEHVGHSSAQ
jgi:hypothetical protein